MRWLGELCMLRLFMQQLITATFYIGSTAEDDIYIYIYFSSFFSDHRFYFPAQLVGSFTPSDLVDKPWSQVPSLLRVY